jgi:hypothetical protein
MPASTRRTLAAGAAFEGAAAFAACGTKNNSGATTLANETARREFMGRLWASTMEAGRTELFARSRGVIRTVAA